MRIAARDLLDLSSLHETGRALADLGAAVVAAGLHAVAPGVPMAVIAMGSFGGAEIAYGSDLDVLLVYEGTTAADVEAAEQAASALFRLCNGSTPAEGIVRIDASLRPEGRQGPLARSLDAFERYHRRWGETWERQALLRARPVAGDDEVVERFVALADQAVWSSPLDEAAEREIRRMKARIERERIPPSDDPQFHLKLGRGSLADVEWTAQLLQLRTGTRATGTRDALDRLEQRRSARRGGRGRAEGRLPFLREDEEPVAPRGELRRRRRRSGRKRGGRDAAPARAPIASREKPRDHSDRAARVLPPSDPAQPQGGRARLLRPVRADHHPFVQTRVVVERRLTATP